MINRVQEFFSISLRRIKLKKVSEEGKKCAHVLKLDSKNFYVMHVDR